MKHQALLQALPAHPARVLCVGTHIEPVLDDIRRVVDGAEIFALDLGDDELPACLPYEDASLNAVVLHGALQRMAPDALQALFGESHRVLGNGGRLVVRDALLPYDRLSPRFGRWLLRVAGVRYTSNEVFAMMEREGFWDCLVLRNSAISRDVVVKGEKVVQRAALDTAPDASSSNPTIQVVK